MRKPKMMTTAPRRIWLQVSDDMCDENEPFPVLTDEVTWCADSVLACEVEYVRADLVPPKIRKKIMEVDNDGYNARAHADMYP